MTDPENTYMKRLKRAIRVWWDPPANALEEHLIGKAIACDRSDRLYQDVASATVVVRADSAVGAGVFIGPNLIATAEHVVEGRKIEVFLADTRPDDLAKPGPSMRVDRVFKVPGLDLAFITTLSRANHWLPLASRLDDDNLMVVGHPKGKYYSLQKARVKKRDALSESPYVFFKDNEIFFGNSGGAIVGCDGHLVGVVSMMSNYDNNRLKQGIGINAGAISRYARELRLL